MALSRRRRRIVLTTVMAVPIVASLAALTLRRTGADRYDPAAPTEGITSKEFAAFRRSFRREPALSGCRGAWPLAR